MHYTASNNISGRIVLIDLEKAFDSISWSFTFKVLTNFGYGMSVLGPNFMIPYTKKGV